MGLMFPKEKQKKYQRDKYAFQVMIHGACDGMCQNKACQNEGITGHHIILRSQGGKDILENGIWLCAECHHFAHHGQGKRDERLTARAFMINVILGYNALTNYPPEEAYRWQKVLQHLRNKENV